MKRPLVLAVALLACAAVLLLVARRSSSGVDRDADERQPERIVAAGAPQAPARVVRTATEPEPDETADSGRADASFDRRPIASDAGRATPARTHVRGSAVLADGRPARSASVALFAREGRTGIDAPLAETRCDERGRFELAPSEPVREALLVACLRGSVPSTREIVLRDEEDLLVGSIELAEGDVITGHVRASGRPLASVEVVALREPTGVRVTVAEGVLRRLGAHFAWASASATTSPDGAYRIGGLQPEVHEVRVLSARGPDPILGLGEDAVLEALAPARDVDFDLPVSVLRVRFLFDARPVAGVEARVATSDGSHAVVSDEHGHARFRLAAESACTLSAEKRGAHPSVRFPLVAPASGTEREEIVVLGPWPWPTLAIELLSDASTPVGEARFLFYAARSESGPPLFQRRVPEQGPRRSDDARARSGTRRSGSPRVPRDEHRAVAGGRDRFELVDVPSGVYRVVVQAGAQLSKLDADDLAACHRYCDVELVVEVAESGLVEQSVRIEERGRLAVSARSQNGVGLAAACILRDAGGRELPFHLVVESEAGSQARDLFDRELPTHVFSSVCSGPCELELSSPGFRPQRVVATIVAGRATPLEVVLERE